MPTRRITRTQQRQHAINAERELNRQQRLNDT
jgi:hypothetical protein